jgi:thiol-disulfide isomerase/thioredoxin
MPRHESIKAAQNPTADPLLPLCTYDDRLRRIVDFRLPDLDGKPVRFQDFDADLVLIDFWGTWCPPCLRSIPHLVDLQERMGRQRLTVVGIACEPDALDKATPRVAEAARRLQVNYPVLLSRNDGSCPLQEALHVQAFPTMVLVDREGRVLWRDQGATPATLARLDRFLASAADAGRVVR